MTHPHARKRPPRSPQTPARASAHPAQPGGVDAAAGPPPSQQQRRNAGQTRRNWAKVEQYLTEVEKAHGFARSWELRERLERGDVTLDELRRR